ncbi:hypothetical protein [Nostoc sp.]
MVSPTPQELKPRFQPPAGNAAPGGSAASKRGGASRMAFPVGDWERDNI